MPDNFIRIYGRNCFLPRFNSSDLMPFFPLQKLNKRNLTAGPFRHEIFNLFTIISEQKRAKNQLQHFYKKPQNVGNFIDKSFEKNHDFFPRKSAGLFVSLHTNFYRILVISFACCVLYWIIKTTYPCGLIIYWHWKKHTFKIGGW